MLSSVCIVEECSLSWSREQREYRVSAGKVVGKGWCTRSRHIEEEGSVVMTTARLPFPITQSPLRSYRVSVSGTQRRTGSLV
jgi:hypothetical protein